MIKKQEEIELRKFLKSIAEEEFISFFLWKEVSEWVEKTPMKKVISRIVDLETKILKQEISLKYLIDTIRKKDLMKHFPELNI